MHRYLINAAKIAVILSTAVTFHCEPEDKVKIYALLAGLLVIVLIDSIKTDT